MHSFSQSIYINLHHIPKGKVISYGNLAKLSGYPNYSRHVGKVLAALPDDTQLPWHKVINSKGYISLSGEAMIRQKEKLEKEGIEVNADGRVVNFKEIMIDI